MSLESSKNLSGVGAILIVIGTLGLAVTYGGILILIGAILFLIGLNGLANFYKERKIFDNTLYAIILAIVGVVVAIGVLVVTALAALASIGITLTNATNWTTFGNELARRFTNPSEFGALWAVIGAVVIAVIILVVFAIVSVIFFRRSLTQLSSKTGIGLFGTAGLLMLIGVVLSITIIGAIIGLPLIWIGWILVAVACFQIRAEPTQAAAPPPPAPPA